VYEDHFDKLAELGAFKVDSEYLEQLEKEFPRERISEDKQK
jgi:hypothetical protein